MKIEAIAYHLSQRYRGLGRHLALFAAALGLASFSAAYTVTAATQEDRHGSAPSPAVAACSTNNAEVCATITDMSGERKEVVLAEGSLELVETGRLGAHQGSRPAASAGKRKPTFPARLVSVVQTFPISGASLSWIN